MVREKKGRNMGKRTCIGKMSTAGRERQSTFSTVIGRH